jgi:hypothetical protein
MNEDYLWDKTGQPDPQIQQLEEILGTLHYQPRPLELQNDLRVPRRRNYLPWLAIAASLLLAILAGGIWLRVRSHDEVPPQQVKLETPRPPVNKSLEDPPQRIAIKRRRHKSASPAATEEALEAKEQLMVALRLASEKLNLVHRKTQIKNQHRIG